MMVEDTVEARYENLRAEFLDLQERHEVLKKTGVSVEAMEPERAVLVKWACAEAARWLDPRGGNGSTDEMGKKLLAMAYHLAQDSSLKMSAARSAVVEECATYVDDVATFYPPTGGSKSLLDIIAKEIRTLAARPNNPRIRQEREIPIPSAVLWSAREDMFISDYGRWGNDTKFYRKWFSRREEFPVRDGAIGDHSQ
jgi:DNA-binding transcriptional MocR family regulator